MVTLTTFNPNYFNTGFQLFKIKEIEVKNLKILEERKVKILFYNELSDTNLFILNDSKIKKILKENKLIDYIEFKKFILPSLKLQFTKKVIAILNYKKTLFI